MWKKKQEKPAVSKSEVVALYRQAIQAGVSLDAVDSTVKKYEQRSRTVSTVDEKRERVRKSRLEKKVALPVRLMSWLLPALFLVVGIGLLGSALYPIASHLVATAPRLTAHTLLAPIPQEEVVDVVPIVVAPQAASAKENSYPASPQILNVDLDYTNLSNWFDDPQPELAASEQANSYTIAIPTLNIKNAKVAIGGTNLNKSLIQYPGTANPGGTGAPVVFGHSVLRQFYNPSEKNPNRYNSIFSTIMTLEPGDEIFVTYQGVKYTYIVRDKTEVQPEDTYILGQRHDAKMLKLVTCTPEGTYLRRGVVTAQLVE